VPLPVALPLCTAEPEAVAPPLGAAEPETVLDGDGSEAAAEGVGVSVGVGVGVGEGVWVPEAVSEGLDPLETEAGGARVRVRVSVGVSEMERESEGLAPLDAVGVADGVRVARGDFVGEAPLLSVPVGVRLSDVVRVSVGEEPPLPGVAVGERV